MKKKKNHRDVFRLPIQFGSADKIYGYLLKTTFLSQVPLQSKVKSESLYQQICGVYICLVFMSDCS